MNRVVAVIALLTILSLSNNTWGQYYNGQVRIDSADRSYLFQITDDVTQFHPTHFYYWFKSGRIYQTQGSFYGKLLHGDYKVVDQERHLLQQGKFKMGSKTGPWRTWYENGRLKSYTRKRFWDGALSIQEYDSNGFWLKKGYEKNNLFTGKQVTFVNDSAVITQYKKGVKVMPKPNKK